MSLPATRPDYDSWSPYGRDRYGRYLCVECGCTRADEAGDNRVCEWCQDSGCACHGPADPEAEGDQ